MSNPVEDRWAPGNPPAALGAATLDLKSLTETLRAVTVPKIPQQNVRALLKYLGQEQTGNLFAVISRLPVKDKLAVLKALTVQVLTADDLKSAVEDGTAQSTIEYLIRSVSE